MVAHGSGRVVVVTGANEGIGHHMATALLDDGYRVAALDIDSEHLPPLAGRYGDRFAFDECDVTTDADVQTAVDGILGEWGSTFWSATPRRWVRSWRAKSNPPVPSLPQTGRRRSGRGSLVGSQPSSEGGQSGSWRLGVRPPRATGTETRAAKCKFSVSNRIIKVIV